ncbi:hypothetical protein FCJ59_36280 [Cupriavidus basilensis]|nr:hypothetical protein [Cupriavidus basilensis]
MDFKYRGRDISIQAREVASNRWDWSYVIRGHGHRQNTREPAASEEIAIDDAYRVAKREIDQISVDCDD